MEILFIIVETFANIPPEKSGPYSHLSILQSHSIPAIASELGHCNYYSWSIIACIRKRRTAPLRWRVHLVNISIIHHAKRRIEAIGNNGLAVC